ncbi:peptide chain release factor N(5)-glutamine methyltransferase [Candidatus Dependentiae bacterium]|nr:peptide chain release factor N(5)-glutamine methyltransferase [Candidatus Dependentiae bacterium]
MKKFQITDFINDLAKKVRSITSDEDSARQHAWWLLEALTAQKEIQLYAKKEIVLSDTQVEQLNKWIKELTIDFKPLQYVLGYVDFLGLKINVQPPILIPRPETEEWCQWLISQLINLKDEKLEILDLCTGSGCIALAFAKNFPNSNVIASDISEKALELCKINKEENKIKNVTFILSDLFGKLPENKKYDLIISNPPYIDPEDWQNLQPQVKLWEDKIALVAPDHRLEIIKKIAHGAREFIKENSILKKYNLPQFAMEIGYNQANEVTKILHNNKWKNIIIKKDNEDLDRLAIAKI